MKAYKKYLFILVVIALVACKKEKNTPEASIPDPNPYVRVDNASSDVDHQIYMIYAETQIPILYTDTLSKSPLVKINLNYQLSGAATTYRYSYPKTKADILSGINFVKNNILPPLGKIKVYSISLLDTLKTVTGTSPNLTTTSYTVLNALSTVAIANVPAIAAMTAAQLKTYKASILTNMLLSPLNTSGALTNFYQVSKAYYSRSVYGTVTDANYLQYKDKKEYGFIPTGTESTSYYLLGDQTADLKDYLNKMFTLSAAEFQTQYGNYPLMMSKYNFLKIALVAIGFDITKV